MHIYIYIHIYVHICAYNSVLMDLNGAAGCILCNSLCLGSSSKARWATRPGKEVCETETETRETIKAPTNKLHHYTPPAASVTAAYHPRTAAVAFSMPNTRSAFSITRSGRQTAAMPPAPGLMAQTAAQGTEWARTSLCQCATTSIQQWAHKSLCEWAHKSLCKKLAYATCNTV